jgi:formylglycine-generating enzyme required for sulfatase activity
VTGRDEFLGSRARSAGQWSEAWPAAGYLTAIILAGLLVGCGRDTRGTISRKAGDPGEVQSVSQAEDRPAVPGFTYLRSEKFDVGGEPIHVYRSEALASRIGWAEQDSAVDTEFVLVPGGRFMMAIGMEGADFDAGATQEVQVRSFLIARTEVTERVWTGIPQGSTFPAGDVDWYEATEWCDELGLRLPTDAEWEFACRAGSTAAFSFGDDVQDVWLYVWPQPEVEGVPIEKWAYQYVRQEVATKDANAFGLFDVHGGVWEWVSDNPPARLKTVAWPGGEVRARRGGGQYSRPYSYSHERYISAAVGDSPLQGLRPAASVGR